MKEPAKPKQPKKPYRTPVLAAYGAVRELTRNVGIVGKNDSMSSSVTKTS